MLLPAMLLPVTCPVCGARGSAPCAACRAEMRPPPSLPPPVGVERCAALFDYGGAAREVVARLKYRNARSSLAYLADGMAALVVRSSVDVVTWVPTTGERRRERGFDHAELLAKAVARRIARPCRRLLRRLPGPAQTGRAADERRRGPPLVATRPLGAARVLVVDDVVTTGATATAAARALSRAGAARVEVVAAARTSPRRIESGMARVRVCG